MTAFVDECRLEWRRLLVPDELADEMAAELEADLAEAGSLEELLGAGADASLFARTWATERGLAAAPRRRRSLLPAALATLAFAAAIAGAALIIHEANRDSSRGPEPLAVVEAQPGAWTVPSQSARMVIIRAQAAAEEARAAAAAEQAHLIGENGPLQVRLVTRNEVGGTNDHSNTLGLVLLIAGLAALLPLTLFGLLRPAIDR